MSKTRKQRQQYDSERKALLGIAAFLIVSAVFVAAAVRGVALCAL